VFFGGSLAVVEKYRICLISGHVFMLFSLTRQQKALSVLQRYMYAAKIIFYVVLCEDRYFKFLDGVN